MRRLALRLAPCLWSLLLAGCGSGEELLRLEQVEYQWAADEPVESAWLPAKVAPGVGDRPIWYRVHAPAVTATDPAVSVTSVLFADSAWVGSTRIDPRGTLVILPLGPAPTTVTIREGRRGGLAVPAFVVGSERTLWARALGRELPTFVVSALIALAGLVLLSTALRRGSVSAYRGLGLFLLSLGVLTAINSPLRHLFGVSGNTLYYVHEIVTTLYPIGFADFTLATFGDGPLRVIRRGLTWFGVYAVVAWGLHFTGLLEIHVGRVPVALFITVFLIQATVLAARRARGNDPSATPFLVGIGALLVISIPDILNGAAILVLPFQTVPWAILAFGLAMVAVIERQHSQAREASQSAARELAAKVAALEVRNREIDSLNQELRHQIAERSRQMVDVFKQGGALVTLAPPLKENDVIDGRYRVIRTLGRGGMGSVHAVERLSDHRTFALKIMAGAMSALAGARFAREAEIAARVSDEHLVKIVDVGGSSSGQLYIVMELVEGRSLEESRARFGDVPWALHVLRQIALGVRALHTAGVVHRDLKPANVLLATGPDGKDFARISDFGISRLDSDTPADANATDPEDSGPAMLEAVEGMNATLVSAAPAPGSLRDASPRLTGTGIFMGTPDYMAPELARGARTARPASDLFALGLIAYEVLAGARAFREPALHFALTGRGLPTLAPLPPAVPAAAAALVFRCLAESAEARPTAQDFIDVLSAVAQ